MKKGVFIKIPFSDFNVRNNGLIIASKLEASDPC